MQEVKIGVPDKIEKSIEIISGKENIEKETMVRKLIYEGIKIYLLDLYARGDISLSKVSELLDLSPHGVFELAKSRGLMLGSGAESAKISRKTAKAVMAA